MTIEVDTITAPAHWASYLINGDASGFDFSNDLWLTRNRHGAGFWDGDYKNGDELTEFAHAYGECNVIEIDNGQLIIE